MKKVRSMAIVPSSLGTGFDEPSAALIPHVRKPLREEAAEMRRIVLRLEAIVAEHTESARRMAVVLGLEEIGLVLSALEVEAGSKPLGIRRWGRDEVVSYLMDSLYDALLGEPSNIFYTTQVAEDVVRYEPLQREFWLECLSRLRKRMEILGQGAFLK